MTNLQPTIDVPLQDHFHLPREKATGVVLARIDTIERELRAYLERNGHRVLTTGGLAILEAERQFEPRGAFARSMHAEDLIFALPDHLTGSEGDYLL